jgi:hypothetical protein
MGNKKSVPKREIHERTDASPTVPPEPSAQFKRLF